MAIPEGVRSAIQEEKIPRKGVQHFQEVNLQVKKTVTYACVPSEIVRAFELEQGDSVARYMDWDNGLLVMTFPDRRSNKGGD